MFYIGGCEKGLSGAAARTGSLEHKKYENYRKRGDKEFAKNSANLQQKTNK